MFFLFITEISELLVYDSKPQNTSVNWKLFYIIYAPNSFNQTKSNGDPWSFYVVFAGVTAFYKCLFTFVVLYTDFR